MNVVTRVIKTGALMCCLALILPSCKKEKNADPTNPTTGSNADGRFSAYKSCDIIAPPAGAKLDPYYKKYLNCTGIPVVSNADVPDEALRTASDVMEFMLKGKENLRAQLVANGCHYGISMKVGAAMNSLPGMTGAVDGNSGRYVSGTHFAVSGADNLLCTDDVNRLQNLLVHEFSHMIHFDALKFLDKNFDAELNAAYSNAQAKGLWPKTYAISAVTEYLAQGVMVWYGVNSQGPEGGDGFVNEIYTREELKTYDPALYKLIEKNFNAETNIPGCLRQAVVPNNIACVPTVTDIDGNVYNVVAIGNQCWMKENLKTSRFNDGTSIPKKTNAASFASAGAPAWIYYKNDSANNNAKFGKQYNWQAASNPKICPGGWHMPSRAEWEILLRQTNGRFYPKSLRSTTGWIDNTGSTNSSGFSALPAGTYYDEDSGSMARFWSATDDQVFNNPYALEITPANGESHLGGITRESGLSCRCLKD